MIVILDTKYTMEMTGFEAHALKALLDAVNRTDAPDYLDGPQQQVMLELQSELGRVQTGLSPGEVK